MSDQILQELLKEVKGINTRLDTLEGKFDTLEGKFDTLEGRFDTLEGKVDRIHTDLTEFKENQDTFNSAIWNLNSQAFQAINDIRSEVVSPWKIRQASKNI